MKPPNLSLVSWVSWVKGFLGFSLKETLPSTYEPIYKSNSSRGIFVLKQPQPESP